MFIYLITGCIGIIGILGAVGRIRNRRPTRLVQTAPSAAVSLGIFGTFVGIYIGLLGFDVKDISASIPTLLEGLKTAFMTSIWGLAVSIGLRFLYSRMDDVEDDGVVRSDEPVLLLQGILNGIEQLSTQSAQLEQTLKEGLKEREAIANDRLEVVRKEIGETREAMVSAFDGFSNRMAEMGVDALVEALGQVVKDFNSVLNDLVGTAFQDMSSAMARLVEWQENYRTDMESMRERVEALLGQTDAAADVLDRTSTTLAQIDERLDHAASSLGSLTTQAADFEAHVDALKTQNAQLEAGLEGIRALGEAAKDVVPTLDQQMKAMGQSLVEAASTSASRLEEVHRSLTDFVETTTRELQETSDAHTQAMENAVDRLDKGLEEELTKALNGLAGSLAALSEQFVRDYQPLTDRLREVVRLAEAVHDRQA